MKQAPLFLLAFLLCSCSFVKKTFSKKHSAIDSSSVSSTIIVDIKKRDSTGRERTVTTSKAIVDSGYSKTTTIKEYFSDEFGFNGESQPSNQAKYLDTMNAKTPQSNREAGRLKYRETTIVEKGNVKREAEQVSATEQNGQLNITDSIKKVENKQASIVKEENSTQKNKDKHTFLSGWWIWLLIPVIILTLYCYYKNYTPSTLWQILMKHIK